MPEEDHLNPTTKWTPYSPRLLREDISKKDQNCDNCLMDIELDAWAQRFYRFQNGIHVGFDGRPMLDENEARNFASLLVIKVYYSNIRCPCAKKPDYEEEWEYLFYDGTRGTFIQQGAIGLRGAALSFVPDVPACNVGSDFLNHVRLNSKPGALDEQ